MSEQQWFEAKVPPPVVGLLALLVQHRLAPAGDGSWVRRGLGTAVAGGAVALVGSAATGFRRHGTTVDPLHPERAGQLVVDGPNALTRNPMYLGIAGLLGAHALARGGVLTWLPVAGFVAAMDRAQIAPEERALRAAFGEEYDAYVRTVPRWV